MGSKVVLPLYGLKSRQTIRAWAEASSGQSLGRGGVPATKKAKRKALLYKAAALSNIVICVLKRLLLVPAAARSSW